MIINDLSHLIIILISSNFMALIWYDNGRSGPTDTDKLQTDSYGDAIHITVILPKVIHIVTIHHSVEDKVLPFCCGLWSSPSSLFCWGFGRSSRLLLMWLWHVTVIKAKSDNIYAIEMILWMCDHGVESHPRQLVIFPERMKIAKSIGIFF